MLSPMSEGVGRGEVGRDRCVRGTERGIQIGLSRCQCFHGGWRCCVDYYFDKDRNQLLVVLYFTLSWALGHIDFHPSFHYKSPI